MFFRIFKKIDMDSVKNSAGNPLNLADFDLICLETKRTHLSGSNAPTHVPIRQKFVPVAQFEFLAKFSTTKGGGLLNKRL